MSKKTATVKEPTMNDVQDELPDQLEPEATDPESVAQQFIFREASSRPIPRELSPEEKQRRELQRRFKKLRGFKPVEKNMAKLIAMVEWAEQRAGVRQPEDE